MNSSTSKWFFAEYFVACRIKTQTKISFIKQRAQWKENDLFITEKKKQYTTYLKKKNNKNSSAFNNHYSSMANQNQNQNQ